MTSGSVISAMTRARDDVSPERRGGRNDSVIAGQVGPGSGNQRRKARDEILRCEEDVGRAVAEGVLEFVDDFSFGVGLQSLKADGGPGHIAAQALEPLPLVGPAGDGGIQ
jgi:hypothetical protein